MQMARRHIHFPENVEEEMVPQFQYQEARQQQGQQHQNRQQQRNRRRQRNHRRQHNRQQPPLYQHNQEQPPAQELHYQTQPLWSPEEDRKLFRAVAEFKKFSNSASLTWKMVLCLYRSMGRVMMDEEILKVQWRRIAGLICAGYLN